nr:HlyC/CorC family transporter [Actinomycetales bacterium]
MFDPTALLIALALLLANAFFVGAEFALISARRTQVEPTAERGSRAARITLRAMDRVSLMMAGAQLGITMCSLGLGAVAEPAVAQLLEVPLGALGISGAVLHTISFTVAMAIVVFFHMVFGEMVPKNIAIARPGPTAIALGPTLFAVVTILRPFIWFLNWSANVFLKMLRVTPQDEVASTFTADQVAAFIEESRKEGILEDTEHQLLAGSVTIGEERLSSVMVPIAELVALPHGATPAQAADLCVSAGFSRFAIRSAGGQLVGYVHLKDFLGIDDDDAHHPIRENQIRPLATIAHDATLEQALVEMQVRGTHFALVVEGERTVGAATLDDVMELLIGEIEDWGARPIG